jgi:flagellar biogenesis protein FliO
MRYLLLFLSCFSSLFADELFENRPLEGSRLNYWHEFINMLAALFFVIILIFLTIWFLKKIARSRIKSLNRSNGIKILEKRSLSPKASLYLLDILGKGVVIAESQAGIEMITHFPDSVNVSELLEKIQEEQKSK